MLNKSLIKLAIVLLYTIIINLNEPSIPQTKLNQKKNLNISTSINYPKAFLENTQQINNDLLATISISKINLYDKPIYKPHSSKNNIEKNITILKESIMPEQEESIIFLMAHSGIGSTAYFKNLHKLEINDKIDLNYNKTIYTYKIIKIYEVEKNGYLEIKKKNTKELILTTCSNEETKQLIIESILYNQKKD